MLRITGIRMELDGTAEDLKSAAAKKLKISPEQIREISYVKKSVDARKKDDVHFVCTVDADCTGPAPRRTGVIETALSYRYELPVCKNLETRPVVVGFGPAGLFAALILAQAGQRPIVVERGADVDQRAARVETFWRTGVLDPDCNVQFGEGGAGTFSDGKLNTGTKDPRSRKVLEEFAAAGAPPEILYLSKPHIGTDKLPLTVKTLREKIRSLGGEIRFETAMKQLILREGRVVGAEICRRGRNPEILETQNVLLAIGHSARDTMEDLYGTGIPMERKPFSIGARIEHLQTMIDRAQYGKSAGHPALGAADYKLAVHLKNGRGVYTFCMCPGGRVVAAASEPGRLATNGMSNFARDGANSNSALLVGIGPEDFGGEHPLAGIRLQQKLEENAFRRGGGGFCAPVQRVEDFLAHRPSSGFGDVQPTYPIGVTPSSLDGCLPEFICDSMRESIRLMDARLKGFACPDALLTAVESRSSSPVRILRGDDFQSVTVQGLYPCGEGAGYAGGIVSAAVDGIRCAEAVLMSARR